MSSQSISFQFHYAPRRSSTDALLVQWLQTGLPSTSGKELLWQAGRAFWLPYAYQDAGKSPAAVQQVAQSAITLLRHQIWLLSLDFEVDAGFTLDQPPLRVAPTPTTSASPPVAPDGSDKIDHLFDEC